MKSFLVAIASLTLGGCVSSSSMCLFRCGSNHSGSTPLVSYLYPDGDMPRQDAVAELQLPITVGLTFVPGAEPSQVPDAAQRMLILNRVRDRFRSLNYVRDIVIIPDNYLGPKGGFEALEQVARLQSLDVIALVSWDQLSTIGENKKSLMYLTIVGSYLFRGSDAETHSLLDLAVVEPKSRALLLRAAGTSALHASSTAVDVDQKLASQQLKGFDLATEQLLGNFSEELTRFSERVKNGDAPVRVVKASGGGGALAGEELLVLMLAALAQCGRRAATRHLKPE
jgi:rhombotail lipoprotein